jgi:hypothetical protein
LQPRNNNTEHARLLTERGYLLRYPEAGSFVSIDATPRPRRARNAKIPQPTLLLTKFL